MEPMRGQLFFLGLGLAPFLSWKHFFPFSAVSLGWGTEDHEIWLIYVVVQQLVHL